MAIIAELGINHQGDIKKAKAMILAAKGAGADIAKFQWYDPAEILGKDSPYFTEATKAQFTYEQHLELKTFCDKVGIEWLVSAFHARQVPFLVKAGMKRFKIASRAALDNELVGAISVSNLPIIVSDGLCDETDFLRVAQQLSGKDVTWLYCECLYPTPKERIDLENMKNLAQYGKFGLSSHCPDITPAIEALEIGASIIEQHVILDKAQVGCDVSSSITFDDLAKLCKHDLQLVPVTTLEQVEWLRVQRSRPELYKYFRQDTPLTILHQNVWWKTLDKGTVRLFIVEKNGIAIGYVGFNPISTRAGNAEFGIFIIPEFQGNGYAKIALNKLLRYGFETYNLSTIYSDCLEYPGEPKFPFYEKLGFEAFPEEHQHIRYKKQGKMISSTKFFMTQDMWRKNGKDRIGGLEPVAAGTAL